MSACKALIVGDGAIGKTCLLNCFTSQTSQWDEGVEPEYEPTTFNNFILNWTAESGETIEAEIWDTAGQEAFEQLRKLSYPNTDIFLIGFSNDSSTSLQNIDHKWIPEVTDSMGSTDLWIVLVGTKSDLPTKQVTTEQATATAKKIGACAFIDTSARNYQTGKKEESGVDELVATLTKLAVMKRNNEKKPKLGDLDGAPAVRESVSKKGATQLYTAIAAFANQIVEDDGLEAAIAMVELCCEGFRTAAHAAGPDADEFRTRFNAAAPGGEADAEIMKGGLAFHAEMAEKVNPVMEDEGLDAAVALVNTVMDNFKAACHEVGPEGPEKFAEVFMASM